MADYAALIYSIAIFALATSVTPGPNNLMLLASGVNFGFKQSIPHAVGVTTGFFVMLVAVGFGLNGLFQAFPGMYQIMKVLGFAYLLYLAWGVATSDPLPERGQSLAGSAPLGFWGAVAFQAVNPKAWMIAVSFSSNYLPQHAAVWFMLFGCLLVWLLACLVVWLVAWLRAEGQPVLGVWVD